MNINEISKFLKDEVKFLQDNEDYVGGWQDLGNGLSLVVCWEEGFGDEKRDDVIQSTQQPDYALVYGIKIKNPYDTPDYWNMLSDKEGNIVTETSSISPNEDYDRLAKLVVDEFENLKDVEYDDNGVIQDAKVVEEDVNNNNFELVNCSTLDGWDYYISIGENPEDYFESEDSANTNDVYTYFADLYKDNKKVCSLIYANFFGHGGNWAEIGVKDFANNTIKSKISSLKGFDDDIDIDTSGFYKYPDGSDITCEVDSTCDEVFKKIVYHIKKVVKDVRLDEDMIDLHPQYDSRKSFYGKAYVDERDNGDKVLYSYGTPVCQIKDGKVYLLSASNGYLGWSASNTTLRHIKDFLQQNGFESYSLKDLPKHYEVKNCGGRFTEENKSCNSIDKVKAGEKMKNERTKLNSKSSMLKESGNSKDLLNKFKSLAHQLKDNFFALNEVWQQLQDVDYWDVDELSSYPFDNSFDDIAYGVANWVDELDELNESCSKKKSKKKLKEGYAGDVFDNLVDRAKLNIDEGADIDEAVSQAIDEGLIYNEDIFDLADNYLSGSDILEMFYEDLYNDLYSEVKDYADEQESNVEGYEYALEELDDLDLDSEAYDYYKQGLDEIRYNDKMAVKNGHGFTSYDDVLDSAREAAKNNNDDIDDDFE